MEVRRPGQQKTAGPSAAIHVALHGQQQIRRPLYLVECEAGAPTNEIIGRCARLLEHVEIVERQVEAIVRGQEVSNERALADLPGACHGDDRHRAKRPCDRGGSEPGDVIHVVNDIHSSLE
jgi:hypothetical protein